MERYILHRRILESGGKHHAHRVKKLPDRPQAETIELKRAAVRVAITSNPSINRDSSVTYIETDVFHDTVDLWGYSEQRDVPHIVITPTSLIPITPRQEIRYGGGRTIGGGTSQEALRRARKKPLADHNPKYSQLN